MVTQASHEVAVAPTGNSATVESEAPQPAVGQLQRLEPYGEPRFSFNLRNAPWSLVLRSFAREMGLSLHFSVEPQGAFTYFDDNSYVLADAVDIFNDYLIPNGMILIWNDTRLTVAKVGDPVPDGLIPYVGLDEIDYLGRNTLATVTIPVKRIAPDAVVAEVSELLSALGKAHPLKNSNRIVITDTGTYLRRVSQMLVSSGLAGDAIKSHVYQLKNAPAESVALAINNFLVVRNPLRGTKGTQLVVPEKTTNSLLVHGTITELADIQTLINHLDRTPSEVLISALLVEVQLGSTDELGVEIGVQDSVLFDRSFIDRLVSITEVVDLNGRNVNQQNILSQRVTPGFNFNNQPLGNNSVGNPGRVGAQGLGNFGVGRINGDLGFGGLVLSAGSESVSVLIRALSASFRTDVLSRPQIRTLDNHEAMIQIGQQVPIVDGVSVTAVGSANPVIRQDKAGIILKVTPRIAPDGKVLINVSAEKSGYQLAPGTGVPIFTDVTNGNVIEAPVKDITTAETAVSVQTGQTIVLGGMITRDVSSVARKVPVLGDIPILGRAFRYDVEEIARKELLIFLTPHIVGRTESQADVNAAEMGRMCFPTELASALHGDLSGMPSGEMTMVPQENGIPGPPEITTTEGQRVAVPPFDQPQFEGTHGWQQFPNYRGATEPERLPETVPALPAPFHPPVPAE